MNGQDRDLTATLAALKSRGCHVNRDWLTECILFFRSENPNSSLKDLETFVFDQWLLGDLREIATCGAFPPNLNNTLKTTLQGKIACQIESFSDIGHSAYNQMQKVRNEDVGNSQVDENKEFQQAWEPKSNRCLHLMICDGVQCVKAIEFKFISLLKTDMMPGIKILLQGPIQCRRGVLLLEEKHITVLGGEVDALAIVNAYENILARKLNVPENPDPYNLTAPPAVQTQPQQPAQAQAQPAPAQLQRTQLQPASQANNANRAPQQPMIGNNGQNRKQQSGPASARPPGQPKKLVQSSLSWSKQSSRPAQADLPRTPSIEFQGNDEDFMSIPLDTWDEEMNYESVPAASSCHSSTSSKPESGMGSSGNTFSRSRHGERPVSAASSTADYFDDDEEFDEALLLEASLALDKVSQPQSIAPKNLSSTVPGAQKKALEEPVSLKRLASSPLPDNTLKKPLFAKPRKETSSQDVTSTTDSRFYETMDDLPDRSPSPPLSLKPFQYLSLMGRLESGRPSVRVKAAVISVTEKLCISKNEWRLAAIISDGSGNLEVEFSNEVLEELFGMSAELMTEMKKQIPKHPENKDIIRQKLAKAQCRLINLNCLMDLRQNDGGFPEVVGVEDISPKTVTALSKRHAQLKVKKGI